MERVTANDIARIARVSRSTISRVVNDYPNVPEDTRQRVMEVIRQTGYIPHQQARNLAGVQSRMLLLFVNNQQDYYSDKIAGSSFFAPLTTLIIDSANRRGYDVVVTQSMAEHSWERARQLIFGQVSAGAIFVGVADRDPRVRPFYPRPTVIIDHRPMAATDADSAPYVVNFANREGMNEAVRDVIDRGCRRIAYITGNTGIYSGRERLNGFRQAMRSHPEVTLDESLIVAGDFSEQSGYVGTLQLLQTARPDAILAGDDECAVGVLKALDEHGISVPSDVAVVGFDDIELARYIRPALTTVSAPKRDIADRAVELLIATIEGRPAPESEIVVPTRLVKRTT